MFHPGREARWQYASETIEHIEEHNCVRGCRFGAGPGSPEWDELGPGGSCGLLAQVFLQEPIEAMNDDGTTVTCTAYRERAVTPVVSDLQLTIEDV